MASASSSLEEMYQFYLASGAMYLDFESFKQLNAQIQAQKRKEEEDHQKLIDYYTRQYSQMDPSQLHTLARAALASYPLAMQQHQMASSMTRTTFNAMPTGGGCVWVCSRCGNTACPGFCK